MSSDGIGCPICESHRCGPNGCAGRPGFVYAPTGMGWFSYSQAVRLEETGHAVHWDDVWSYSKYGVEPERDRLVIVDTETTGLDLDVHDMIEIAWGEPAGLLSEAIVPHSTHTAMAEALRINRYDERNLGDSGKWAPPEHMLENILTATFEGATLMGSNVQFDRGFITKWLADRFHFEPRWTHRPLEIGSYVAGHFGLRKALGLEEAQAVVKNRLGLDLYRPDHTAMGDVRAVESLWLSLTETE